MPDKRPRVRIRFKYNTDTGEIEEFIIDDNAPAASEAYHDKVARAVASRLGRDLTIEEAGTIRLADEARRAAAPAGDMKTKDEGAEREESADGEGVI